MTVKKGGLNMGKGLQSLIPVGSDIKKTSPKTEESNAIRKKQSEDKQIGQSDTEENGITEVRTTSVIPNMDQPRKDFEDGALHELADSIRNYGVLQPLLVQKKGKYYEIIAGERRWRAAKIAGLKKIPVIIKHYGTQSLVEISLIENIQRQDLNPIEEAVAFKRLIDEFNLKQEELAGRVSKSRVYLSNSMRLLKLDERVQKMLADGLITAGHARTLLRVEDKDSQFGIATKIATEALSVRETENLIRRLKKSATMVVRPDSTQADAVFSSIEEQLRSVLGTQVYINRKSTDKGCITIEYYSSQELDRILDLLHSVREEKT